MFNLLNIVFDVPMVVFCIYYNYNVFGCLLLSLIFIEWIYVKNFKAATWNTLANENPKNHN
jgi:hypothetical protein